MSHYSLPAGHEHFVRIVSPAGALSTGVPGSNQKTFAFFAPGRFSFFSFILLHIAQGSEAELESQIFISRNLYFMHSKQAEFLLQELEEISRMIIGLQKSLRRSK